MDLKKFLESATDDDLEEYADNLEIVALDPRLIPSMNTLATTWIHARNLFNDGSGKCANCGLELNIDHKFEILRRFEDEIKVWHSLLNEYCIQALGELSDIKSFEINFQTEQLKEK